MNKLVLLAISLLIISVSGCISINDTNDDEKNNNDTWDVTINELYISYSIEFVGYDENIFVLFPTLVDTDQNLLELLNENLTIEKTPFGYCLNISIKDMQYFSNPNPQYGGHYQYVLNSQLTFNTGEKYSIKERFCEDTPGLTLWEEKNDNVYTKIYCNSKVRNISWSYERGDSVDFLSDSIDDNNNWGPGWKEFQLNRHIHLEPFD